MSLFVTRSSLTTALTALLLCGCGDRADVDHTADAPPAPAPAAPAAAPLDSVLQLALMPMEDSGASGSVTVEVDGQRTLFTVVLRARVSGVHPGSIQVGRCDAPGGAIERLEPILTDQTGAGEALTAVDMPASMLLDGNHIVIYHQPGGFPGAAAACAELPSLAPPQARASGE